jgi:hypothetical protein
LWIGATVLVGVGCAGIAAGGVLDWNAAALQVANGSQLTVDTRTGWSVAPIGLGIATGFGVVSLLATVIARAARQSWLRWLAVGAAVVALGVIVFYVADPPGTPSTGVLGSNYSGVHSVAHRRAGLWLSLAGAIVALSASVVVASTRLPGSRRKRCPDCAEHVSREARVCKHCGHRFAGGQPSEAVV